eukprot:SAG31_NODE_6047_length_2192_cov_3.823220_2_plen_143_part_00
MTQQSTACDQIIISAGITWTAFNIAQIHNKLEKDPSLRFCPATVDATPSNSSQYFSPAQNGAYSSLLLLNETAALVCYNREPIVKPFERGHKPPMTCQRPEYHGEWPLSLHAVKLTGFSVFTIPAITGGPRLRQGGWPAGDG